MGRRSFLGAMIVTVCGIQAVACRPDGQPSGVRTLPLALTPVITESAETHSEPKSDQPPTPAPTETPKNQVIFRDDFDGPVIDAKNWTVYKKSGSVGQNDGWLNVSIAEDEPEFPLVITKGDIFPESGPWYFETQCQWFNQKNESTVTSLNLDVNPPSGTKDEGAAPPLLQCFLYFYYPTVRFRTETKELFDNHRVVAEGPFRWRVECDAKNQCQVFINGTLLHGAETTRRPRVFWVGYYPNQRIEKAKWLNWKVDYVETGILEKSITEKPNTSAPEPTPAVSNER